MASQTPPNDAISEKPAPPAAGEIDLLEYLLVFWRRKWTMAFIALVVMVGAFVRTKYLVPEIYAARATLLPLKEAAGGTASSLLRSIAPTGGLLGGIGISGGMREADRLANILRSQKLLQQVAADLDLMRLLTRKDWEKARRKRGETFDASEVERAALELAHENPKIVGGLAEGSFAVGSPETAILSMSDDALQALVSKLPSVRGTPDAASLSEIRREWFTLVQETFEKLRAGITIGVGRDELIALDVQVEDDPRLAARIANRLIEQLDSFLQRNKLTEARRNREFIEERFSIVQADLYKAEQELEAFKSANRLASLTDQTMRLVSQAGDLKAQLEAKKIERGAMVRLAVSPNSTQVKTLSYQIEGLGNRLTELERGGGDTTFDRVGLTRLPALERQLADLMREKVTQETLYTLLAQEYEAAKIQEVRDQTSFQVLDIAQPAVQRLRPRRAIDMIVGTVAGLILAVVYALAVEFGSGLLATRRRERTVT